MSRAALKERLITGSAGLYPRIIFHDLTTSQVRPHLHLKYSESPMRLCSVRHAHGMSWALEQKIRAELLKLPRQLHRIERSTMCVSRINLNQAFEARAEKTS